MKDDILLKLEDMKTIKCPMKTASLWKLKALFVPRFKLNLIHPLPIKLYDVSVPVPNKMYVDKKCTYHVFYIKSRLLENITKVLTLSRYPSIRN